jgi:PAS domain S-box-containing protein
MASQPEQARLAALSRFRILDADAEPLLDDVAAVAAQLCNTPYALISFVDEDRECFASSIGLSLRSLPRDSGFSSRTIAQKGLLVVEDTHLDPRFAGNVLVVNPPHIRFFAGVPLETHDGFMIGTLCILDDVPRTLSNEEGDGLRALGRQVMAHLEHRSETCDETSKHKLRNQILESAIDYAIFSMDLSGLVTTWNEGARHILGWTEREIQGQPGQIIFTPEDRAKALPEQEIKIALETGCSNDERWHLRKDGTRFWASGELMPLRDDQRNPIGVVKIIRDRTEQWLANQRQIAILKLGDQLANLADFRRMASIAAEAVGTTLNVSITLYGALGEPGTGLVVEGWWCSPDLKAMSPDNLMARTAEGLPHGHPVVVSDTGSTGLDIGNGVKVRAYVHVPLLENDSVAAVFSVYSVPERAWTTAEVLFVREIAERTRLAVERRRAEAALQDLAENLERQVETRLAERNRLWTSTSELMATADRSVTLNEVNMAWTRLLGWDESYLLGRSLYEIVREESVSSLRDAVEALELGLPVAGLICKLAAKDGTSRIVNWSLAPDGPAIHLVGRDITAQLDVEERLRQSQKMDALGQLTGGIAHDFNNLLTGITGSLDLMQLRLNSGRIEGLDRFMQAARTAARRAAALTHRLLAFARHQPLDPKPIDVNALLAGMEELLRRTLHEGIRLDVTMRKSRWSVLTDAHQLENAVLNLVINARDAMPAGGEIRIVTEDCRLDDVSPSAEANFKTGEFVCISVTDTGTGMPPEIVARVFEPFFTTKPEGQGTGLGLAMIYGFAKQCGGDIRILSTLGRGTTIKLYLPRTPVREPTAAQDVPVAVSRGHGESVFVVEDDPTVRLILGEVLNELGYRRIEAPDGQTAVPILKSELHIDLLITDIGLPFVDGRQLADIAREQRPGLKILFITGYAESDLAARERFDGNTLIITKPIGLEALSLKVREILEAR